MLLNSILLILFLANIILNNMEVIGAVFFGELLLNLFLNPNLKNNIKKLKVLIYIYLGTFIIQILSVQEGEVLFKIFSIYITKTALLSFAVNFMRIINLIMLSWLVSKKSSIFNHFGEYKRVMENVVELVPEVFVIFRKRMRLKNFFRHIFKKIKI